MNDIKPGYQTTEFWLTLLAQVQSAVIQSGLIQTDRDMKVVSLAGSFLTIVVYAFVRGKAKAQ